jgi:hypothetical protein
MGSSDIRWFNDDDKSFATGITLELEETEVTLRPLFVGSYLLCVFKINKPHWFHSCQSVITMVYLRIISCPLTAIC